jgi:hypothetical protein
MAEAAKEPVKEEAAKDKPKKVWDFLSLSEKIGSKVSIEQWNGHVTFRNTELMTCVDMLMALLGQGELQRNTVADAKKKYGNANNKISRTNHNKVASIARSELKKLRAELTERVKADQMTEEEVESDINVIRFTRAVEEAAELDALAKHQLESWQSEQSGANIEYVDAF